MAAAATVRPQNKTTSNRRHIPVEIVEEILLHLPVKSVLRFSSVSKSWRSMISQLRFIQRYGAVSGRERILISPFIGDDSIHYTSCSLSSISSDLTIQKATKIVSPFMETPNLVATCDELWCVEVGESLFLWNPSMNTYKKLADASPPLRTGIGIAIPRFYGLGYDCVGEDYKILKLSVHDNVVRTTELYSLRKDSWRNIKLFPGVDDRSIDGVLASGAFVSGALHWVDYSRDIIVYFNLTTEMYGEVAPPLTPSDDNYIGVIVLRRKLCVFLNYYTMNNFILWAMEDDKEWSKMYEIGTTNGIPYCFDTLTPLYLYDNGDVLFEIMSVDGNWNIFMNKKGDPILKEIVGQGNHMMISNSYVYVESLVSPATNMI